jgi:hypothetical protein
MVVTEATVVVVATVVGATEVVVDAATSEDEQAERMRADTASSPTRILVELIMRRGYSLTLSIPVNLWWHPEM